MIETIFVIAILIMSVVIHEVSHGFVAEMLGDPTARLAGRLTLNPLKHLDPVGSFLVPLATYILAGFAFGWARPVPYNPYNLRAGRWGPALVAAVGPLANILLAILFGLILRLGVEAGLIDLAGPFAALAKVIVFINILLAVFNLIPVPPLDGSKILFSVLSYRYNNIASFLERNQLFLILFLLFFVWQYFIPLVSYLTGLIAGSPI